MDLAQMIGNACKDRKSLDTAYNSMVDIFESLVPVDDPGHRPTSCGARDNVSSYPQTEKRRTVKRKKPIGETERAKSANTKRKKDIQNEIEYDTLILKLFDYIKF